MSDLHCPVCSAELDLTTVFASGADASALERLVRQSYPLGTAVLRYIGLHKPPKHALNARKKIKLLPDIERGAIARNGRDWAAPRANWALAIDQMLATASAQRLDLPLKGHGYLYSVLQGMADKAEGAQERQTEADRRAAAQATRATVQVRGQSMGLGDALDVVYGGRDPALAALDHSARNAAPCLPRCAPSSPRCVGAHPKPPPKPTPTPHEQTIQTPLCLRPHDRVAQPQLPRI